ncbi:Cytochrome c oxidase, subunit VIb [Corchorus capsularis]|uniref:Cytochrome c oxidase, subunit VIb n=1 Tax=Corchorus capsularis TaxID=210143 RepID=A0A1R3I3H5_COCAP|nr:Cytochrome c oxidase, subunit VIb [Corchorus capsularis]
MSTAVDPHDKMRSRDVNKVARGEQAPKPPHEFGTVSPPPSPQSTSLPPPHKIANKEIARKLEEESDEAPKSRHCYESYVEYHKCIKEKGKNASQCDKFARHYRSLCPDEWIERWDEARAAGTFPIT